MEYLCRVVDYDHEGDVIALHRPSNFKIHLTGSASRVDVGEFGRDSKVACSSVKKQKEFFSGRYRTVHGPEEESLMKEGCIAGIFFDTSVRDLLVVGMWNDVVRFDGFRFSANGKAGRIAGFAYRYSSAERPDVNECFGPEYAGKIIRDNFHSLLGEATNLNARSPDRLRLVELVRERCPEKPYTVLSSKP